MELISMILSIIFMITFVALLYSTKKHIFDIGVADCMKIKDPARFEAPQGWFYIHISANICPFSYDLYTYFINQSKQLGRRLRRLFQCIFMFVL